MKEIYGGIEGINIKYSPPCGGEYENGSNKTLLETNVLGSMNH